MRWIKNGIDSFRRRRDSVSYWRSKGAKIGEDCKIYSYANLGSEPYLVTIGSHVRITSSVTFITHDGGVWVLRGIDEKYRDADIFGEIVVGDNVHIGSNSVIMPGVHIGSNCIIGCGAIVTKDIPSNSVAVGVPARVIESIDDYIKKNIDKIVNTKSMNQKEKKEYLLQRNITV